MLLVIPKLASDPNIFGIYTVCISLSIFFSYADLGFISAGQKFAAEYFARGDKIYEINVIGFVLFLLSCFLVLSTSVLIYLAYNPELIISSASVSDLKISKKLLLILALSSPVIVLQRFNAMIYSVRINDYIYQLFEITGNILKVISIGYFVGEGKYDIVGYFLTFQIISLASSITSVLVALNIYQIKLSLVLNAFRFSSEMYDKTKSLALSSLMITIAWILYFELDSVILSKFYGVKVVAVYAIGFSLLSFTRNLYNTLYSPFQAKFNQLNGLGDDQELFRTFNFVIKCTLPLCIIPSVVMICNMKLIVLSWIGSQYQTSILISQLFILISGLSGLTIPLSYLLLTKSKNRVLRLYAIILPIIFYGSLVLFNDYLGVITLAVAKVITIFSSCLITFIAVYKILGSHFFIFYLKILKKMFLPVIVMILLIAIVPYNYDVAPRSFLALVQVALHIFPAVVIPSLIYIFLDEQLKETFIKFIIKPANK
jgi:O-antigen/teichoic acid export membrane protein